MSTTSPKLRVHSIVLLRYRRVCRAASKWTRPGLTKNCAGLLMAKLMPGRVASPTYYSEAINSR